MFVLPQLHDNASIKSLVEKASYSQRRRCTMHNRPVASPGYIVRYMIGSHDLTIMLHD